MSLLKNKTKKTFYNGYSNSKRELYFFLGNLANHLHEFYYAVHPVNNGFPYIKIEGSGFFFKNKILHS